MNHFESRLDENPADWDTRRVYADWLEERGDDRLAAAQRWMAANEKHCSALGEPAGYSWHAFPKLAVPYRIPDKLVERLPTHPDWERWQHWPPKERGELRYAYYPSRRAAEEALATALDYHGTPCGESDEIR